MYALGPQLKRIPGILHHLTELVSYKYWKPDSRKFRDARTDWRRASAQIRVMLADIDIAFDKAGNRSDDIVEDLYDIKMSSQEARKLGKTLNMCANRLSRLRKDDE
jgi:hypothetical protein